MERTFSELLRNLGTVDLNTGKMLITIPRPGDAPRPAHHHEPQRARRQGRRASRRVFARREEAVGTRKRLFQF